MSSTGAKGSQQTNKKTKKGFKQREQKTTEVCPGLAHRTVSGAPPDSGGRRTKIHGRPKKHIKKLSKTIKTIVAHKIQILYLSI
jgi:hypothetical protein